MVSAYMTSKMGIEVTLQSINVWPRTITIRDFRIANPSGFKSQTAFWVKKTKVDYRFSALIGNPSEIDQIILDGVLLNVELKNPTGSDNNWVAIGAEIAGRKKGRAVIIRKVIIQDMTVNIQGVGAKALGVSGERHIDHLEFNDIDSREGFPTKELVQEIFRGAGIMKYLDQLLNPVRDILRPFNIFGQKTEPSNFSEGPDSP